METVCFSEPILETTSAASARSTARERMADETAGATATHGTNTQKRERAMSASRGLYMSTQTSEESSTNMATWTGITTKKQQFNSSQETPACRVGVWLGSGVAAGVVRYGESLQM